MFSQVVSTVGSNILFARFFYSWVCFNRIKLSSDVINCMINKWDRKSTLSTIFNAFSHFVQSSPTQVFLPVFHRFFVQKGVIISFLDSRWTFLSQTVFENKAKSINFWSFFIFASKTCKKHRKKRFWPSFGLGSTQMLVKIYNNWK